MHKCSWSHVLVFLSPPTPHTSLTLYTPHTPHTVFIDYPTDVNAALGTNVTLVCVADQPEIRWQVNNVQLLDSFLERGLILEVGPIESQGQYNRTTITFPASEDVNTTIFSIICQAGPNPFSAEDGDIVTISVYGEFTVECVCVCVCVCVRAHMLCVCVVVTVGSTASLC